MFLVNNLFFTMDIRNYWMKENIEILYLIITNTYPESLALKGKRTSKNNEMILLSKTDLAQILNCLKLLTVKLSWKLQLAAALLQNLN